MGIIISHLGSVVSSTDEMRILFRFIIETKDSGFFALTKCNVPLFIRSVTKELRSWNFITTRSLNSRYYIYWYIQQEPKGTTGLSYKRVFESN